MEFTGERYVPGAAGLEELYVEHMSRYDFAKGLAAGRRVLDVGCGCGYGTHHLAAGADFVLGVDRSGEAVEYARENYPHPQLAFAVMDAARLCLEGRFGLVTCFELIEHVEDPEAVLRGVHDLLDDSGVFMVSTPNKATYRAGGEDGRNPFHFREYHRDEFEGLLNTIFPSVRILYQRWVEGMVIGPHRDLDCGGDVRAGSLPADGARPRVSEPDMEPPYFMGICARRPILDAALADLRPAALCSRAVRYDGLKEAARRLEHEFDRRGKWAQELDRAIHSKDETIRALMGEIADMRKQFDERGRWAERLNGELRQSGALVERLAEENRCLRDALAAKRPAGWTRVIK
jgi:SAM-dependent methyltransferase